MAKRDEIRPGRKYPHGEALAPEQKDAGTAVGDDLPKTPAVEDLSQPAPGRPAVKTKAAAKSRSKQEEQ